MTVFTFDNPGTYLLSVSAAAEGAYTLTPYLVGDVDGDLEISSNDAGLVAEALGSARGDTSYNEMADADGDGDVDAQDLAVVQSAFGFVSNQAPTVAGRVFDAPSFGNETTLSLDAEVQDPEGEDVLYVSPTITGAQLIRSAVASSVSLSTELWQQSSLLEAMGYSNQKSPRLVCEN